MRNAALCLAILIGLLAGCSGGPSTESFDALAEEFVFSVLALSPVAATSVGYHSHNGISLDNELDDFSEQALDRQRILYRDFRERFAAYDPSTLTPDQRADLAVLTDQIELGLLELETIQAYKHDPTTYIEFIGSALFDPYVHEYAPKEERFRHIISRIQRIPVLLDQARANLVDSPEIWNTVAQEENAGTIDLIDRTLREAVPESLKAAYEGPAQSALMSLRAFGDYLKTSLSKQPGEWRLGEENYARKFRYALATDSTPDEVLADAEREMQSVREQMHGIARPLHKEWFPAHSHPDELNTVVKETLDRIAQKQGTRESYFADARRDLAETTAFVREKGLVPLHGRDNLEVIETPEFMRGIYSVGGFSAAPTLEPELGAYYWLTPIPAGWPADRVASKLREYNFYGMKLLTIHEAMPGHYVQFEYANSLEPRTRRVIRGVFGNGPYIEGWAVYATEMLLDEGYLDNSPELRLTFLKQQLRVVANTILDVRLQTRHMTDEQAMSLMLDQGFQENEEATGKLQRAKLSSCQLPTYYVGWRDWHRLRNQYKEAKGAGFSLAAFHKAVLEASAVPVPVLAQLLLNEPLKR